MAIYHQDIADIELNSGSLHRSFLGHSIGLGDAAANRFGVRIFRDGVAESLSGVTCQGFFRNANGENIALTSYGTIDGNVAYVTLPQACYNVEGMFTLAIKLVGGGVTGTMRIIDGMVDNTNTGSAVAPTGSVPTYQEVLSVYEQMQTALSNYDAKVTEQDEKIDSLKSAIDYNEVEINDLHSVAGYHPIPVYSINNVSLPGYVGDFITNANHRYTVAFTRQSNSLTIGVYKSGTWYGQAYGANGHGTFTATIAWKIYMGGSGTCDRVEIFDTTGNDALRDFINANELNSIDLFIPGKITQDINSSKQKTQQYIENVVEKAAGIIKDEYVINGGHSLKGAPDASKVEAEYDAETKDVTITILEAFSDATSVGTWMLPQMKANHSYKVAVEYSYPESYPNPYTYVRANQNQYNIGSGSPVALNGERRTTGQKDVFDITPTADSYLAIYARIQGGFVGTFSYKLGLYDVTGMELPANINDFLLSFPDSISLTKAELRKVETEISDNIINSEYKQFLKGTSSIPLGNYSVGDVVDVTPLNTAGTSHYTLLLSGVRSGEKFNIYAVDGNTSRPWAFLDSSYHLLSMAYDAYAQDVEIVAPSDAEYLLVQVGSSYYTSAKITRHESLRYLANGEKIGVEQFNDGVDVVSNLENAVSVAKGDSSSNPKSRANMFSLLHFSDIHGSSVNIQRILQFANTYKKYIYDILHTGDAPNTYYSDTNPFALVGGDEIMEVVGNHECWIQGQTWPRPYTATAQQVYEKYFAPYISSWGVTSPGTNLCYYYKDYATAKVRLIVLDCIHYDDTQENWFVSAMSGAKEAEYRVIAVTHYPAMTGLDNIDCTFGTYGESLDAVTPPTGTDQVERMPESAFSAVDDFIAGGGEFVCWLSGHTHGDFIGTVKNHGAQIQIIISTGKTMNGNGDAARVNGTKTQDLFNVFVVDGNNKLIKLVRIGADKDRYLRSRKTLCLSYDTKQVISNS